MKNGKVVAIRTERRERKRETGKNALQERK